MSHVEIARRAIDAGIKMIQLREKNLSRKEIYDAAAGIRELTVKSNVVFIVNDYVDIALAVSADGVHLGQEDFLVEDARRILGKGKLIGISTHSLVQAVKAQKAGADYIGFGPVFRTQTKDAGKAKGIKALSKLRKHIDIPIVAIGGITHDNVSKVLNCGGDAAAVAAGILSGDIRANVKKYMQAIS